MAFMAELERFGGAMSRAVGKMGFAPFLALAILLIVTAFIVELVINALGDGKVGAFSKKLKKFIEKEGAVYGSNALKFDAKCGKKFSKNTRLLWKNYMNLKTETSKQCFISAFTGGKIAAKRGVYGYTSLFCALMLIAAALMTGTGTANFLVASAFPFAIYVVLAVILNVANDYFNRSSFKAIEYIVSALGEKMNLNVLDAKNTTLFAAPAAEKQLSDAKMETDEKIDYIGKISEQVDTLISCSNSKDTFSKVLASLEAAYRHNYMKRENKERLGAIIERVKCAMAAL